MGLSQIFMQILNMGMTASVVIVAVLLARGCMYRLPKKYVYFMWLIVGIRLVCPVAISSPVSIFNLAGDYGKDSLSAVEELLVSGGETVPEKDGQKAGDKTESKSQETGVASVAIPDMVPDKELAVGEKAEQQEIAATVGESQNEKTTHIENKRQPKPSVQDGEVSGNQEQPATGSALAYFQKTTQIAAILWVAGLILLLLWNFYLTVGMKLRLQKAVIYRDNIYECDNISSPFVMGLLHPHIYIPFRLGEEEREYILKHEQYHIKRKDYLVKFAAFLLVALYWFHPLVWISYFCMVRDMEMSCDEYVLGTMDADIRGEYSKSLLGFAMNTRKLSMSFLAFGETNTRKRVKNVMRYKKYKKGIGILAAVLILAVGATCLTNARVRGEQRNGDAQKEAKEDAAAKTESKYEVAAVVGEAAINGYQLKLVLAAEDGKTKEDMLESNFGDFYKGTFVLMTFGEDGSLCDEQELSFPNKQISEIYYPENVSLVLKDYDGDGVEDDFSLGQGQTAEPALGNYMVYKFFTVDEDGSIVQYRTSTENGETIFTIPGEYSKEFEVKNGKVSYLGLGESGTQKMRTNVIRVVSVKDEHFVDVEPEKGIFQAVKNIMPTAVADELEDKGVWHLIGNSYLLSNGISYDDITLRLDFTYYKDGRLSQYVSKEYGFVSELPKEKIDESQAAVLAANFAQEFCNTNLTEWQIWQIEAPAKWGDGYAYFQDIYGSTYLVWLLHNMVVDYQAGDGEEPLAKADGGLSGGKDGIYENVDVRSVSRSYYGIDSYIDIDSSVGEEAIVTDAPAFSKDCRFFINTSMNTFAYKEVPFDTFADYINGGNHYFEKMCTIEMREGLITKIYLNNTYYKNGFSISQLETDETDGLKEYRLLEKLAGDNFLSKYFSLEYSVNADIAERRGTETLEVYTGNTGDGDCALLLVRAEDGELLYCMRCTDSQAGRGSVFLGTTYEGTPYLLFFSLKRWEDDFGEYIYDVYDLGGNGEIHQWAGSSYYYGASGWEYDDSLFRKWTGELEGYLENSTMLFSSQGGEISTDRVVGTEKYTYEKLKKLQQ